MRKLAERSQRAASEISELSSGSVEVAVKAGQMLNQLVPDIQKTSDLVQEISAASSEQDKGVTQIDSAVQQINQVTQQSASASEELASMAEELSAQATQLYDTISFFKVDNAGKTRHIHEMKRIKQPAHLRQIEQKQAGQREEQKQGVNIQLYESTDKDDREFEEY